MLHRPRSSSATRGDVTDNKQHMVISGKRCQLRCFPRRPTMSIHTLACPDKSVQNIVPRTACKRLIAASLLPCRTVYRRKSFGDSEVIHISVLACTAISGDGEVRCRLGEMYRLLVTHFPLDWITTALTFGERGG